MNKKETVQIMTMLQLNYHDSFKDMSDIALKGLLNQWQDAFRDDDYLEVETAVKAHIYSDTNRFMPPIGVIRNRMTKLRQGKELGELEAWALVSKATKNGIYGYKEEFEKLPPAVQRAVGSAEIISDWAKLSEEEVSTVIQSNFIRAYRNKLKADTEMQALPQDIKAKIETSNLKFLGGQNE